MGVVKSKLLFYIFLLCAGTAYGQGQPIGFWNSLLPYNTAYGVVSDGVRMFTVSKQAFYIYDNGNFSFSTYSKVDGMSDIGMQRIGYDAATGTAVLVYTNGNIDLYKDNTFYNVPDLKQKAVAGEKYVYQVHIENGTAYLATSLGILVLDLTSRNIEETYQFISASQFVPVKGFGSQGNYFYATTTNGLYRIQKNSAQIQNFLAWERKDTARQIKAITSLNNKLYFSSDTAMYVLTADTLQLAYTTNKRISHVDVGFNTLLVSRHNTAGNDLLVMDTLMQLLDTLVLPDTPTQAAQLANGDVYIAGYYSGLFRMSAGSPVYYYPLGPGDANSFDIYAYNRNLWIAHGGYTDRYLAAGNGAGLSNLNDGKWTNYRQWNYQPFYDSVTDLVSVVKDESDGTVYGGSFTGGLFQLNADKTYKIYKQGSILDPSIPNGNRTYQVAGTAFDNDNNLWVTMFGSLHELYVKEKATGNWYEYTLNYSRNYPYNGGPIAIDESNHVWYVCLSGRGIIGYDAKGTFADATDDKSVHLVNGVGFGNLPNNVVNCVAIDKNDNLWIGTIDGIGILYNASGSISQRNDAEIPVVQYDKYAGYLFAGENVRTIAVDGGNRKWIGTDNGVWLLSPDAGSSTIINRFNTDNSPLPSNKIQKISIDKITGDVYIGTDQGLVCYRGTATEGGTSNSNVLTFPNPVPSGYKGTIAIKGLVANADVRITDINGQLVYRTTAQGGQAVWSGMDYKGHRVQTGVYLIFATNADGSQAYAGKMVFIN